VRRAQTQLTQKKNNPAWTIQAGFINFGNSNRIAAASALICNHFQIAVYR
jgi:hypothetical protein